VRASAQAYLEYRAWLALLAGRLPVVELSRLRLIVTPGTVLRWHRDLLRRRWTRRSRPSGAPANPPAGQGSGAAVGARNPSWGYRRIHGELARLGIRIAPSTVWEILKTARIDPAPRRDAGSSWAAFLRSQAAAILATDFVVIDLLDGIKAYVLAVIERASRRVRVLGATLHPPRLEAMIGPYGQGDLCAMFSVIHTPYWDTVGNPVLAVPMGFTADGMPLSLELTGPAFGEAAILRLGDAFSRGMTGICAYPSPPPEEHHV